MGVVAQGRLRYVNNSPDTLREMYFHQYLNAFKPGSKWSESDAAENRERCLTVGMNELAGKPDSQSRLRELMQRT